jgi:hypothetical protein
MQAMMDMPARGAPRVISAGEAFVADLVERLGEKALLVQERRGEDGRARLLAVVDADVETLAAEAARAAGDDAVAVEIIGLDAWRVLRRLAAAGLLQFTQQARELYRSAALPMEPPAAEAPDGRGAEAIAEADRAPWPVHVRAHGAPAALSS